MSTHERQRLFDNSHKPKAQYLEMYERAVLGALRERVGRWQTARTIGGLAGIPIRYRRAVCLSLWVKRELSSRHRGSQRQFALPGTPGVNAT